MKNKVSLLLIILSFSFQYVSGQTTNPLFSRLQAISNHGVTFYNVDGIEITSQEVEAEFSPKIISKKFKQLSIKEKELTFSDSLLRERNYYVTKSEEEPPGIKSIMSYYFVESKEKNVTGFTFASVNKTDKEFERAFIRLVLDKAIPGYVYNSTETDSINFAGRKIPLGNSCHWMGINNVQCPYYGQMNWSVHQDAEDANRTVNNQLELIKSRKNGRVVADTSVKVIFEGTETLARKIVYDFTGITSAMVGMTGGKTLTIYFVSAAVRQHYVSCVMSFWNNDQINPGGLSPLLEQVMKLE